MYAIILSTIAILAHNTTVITTLLVTILAKAIVAQTQIQEDAADIEDNLGYRTKRVGTLIPIIER